MYGGTSSVLSLFSCAAGTISSRNGAPPFSAGRFDAGRSVGAPQSGQHGPSLSTPRSDKKTHANEIGHTARYSDYFTNLVL